MPLVDSIPVILVIHRLVGSFSARTTQGDMRGFGCGRERRRRRKRRRRRAPDTAVRMSRPRPARAFGTLETPETPTRGDAELADAQAPAARRPGGKREPDAVTPRGQGVEPRRDERASREAARRQGRRPGRSTKWGLVATPAPIFRSGQAVCAAALSSSMGLDACRRRGPGRRCAAAARAFPPFEPCRGCAARPDRRYRDPARAFAPSRASAASQCRSSAPCAPSRSSQPMSPSSSATRRRRYAKSTLSAIASSARACSRRDTSPPAAAYWPSRSAIRSSMAVSTSRYRRRSPPAPNVPGRRDRRTAVSTPAEIRSAGQTRMFGPMRQTGGPP